LTISHVRDVVHVLVTRDFTIEEPMPPWETVDLRRLEQILAAPQQSGFGIKYYPRLSDKAAVLLYLMVKNHAWENGNKRMALISTLVFLGLNGRWWPATPEIAHAHVTWVAASDARLSKEVLNYLSTYFDRNIVDLEQVLGQEAQA
jgi:death-on-curing protein